MFFFVYLGFFIRFELVDRDRGGVPNWPQRGFPCWLAFLVLYDLARPNIGMLHRARVTEKSYPVFYQRFLIGSVVRVGLIQCLGVEQ
ncbi:hypothetical protein D3C76_1705620 [compost metagenome]